MGIAETEAQLAELSAQMAGVRFVERGGLLGEQVGDAFGLRTRASERRIALPTRCVQSLKLHREQRKREREAAGPTRQHDGHVFTTTQADRSTRPTSPAPS